ncbi:hypothetical protein [Achromobacter aloeverae]|uniref:hypothetical protein n=1 Tax=Achromobacter aloeverae TaxID=1750518 RepID=UPI001864C1C7|nr:hypothetical protein [Achromobacter aloeverae]
MNVSPSAPAYFHNPGFVGDQDASDIAGGAGASPSRAEQFSAAPSRAQRARASRRERRANNPSRYYVNQDADPAARRCRLAEALPYCELAESIGSGSVPQPWVRVTRFNEALVDKLTQGQGRYPKIYVDDGVIKDGASGFSAQVVRHKDKNEYVLVFGDSGKGWAKPRSLVDKVVGLATPFAKGITAGLSAVGLSMRSYDQAKVTASELQRLLGRTLAGKSHTLTLVGRGQGGADAQFAALHATPALRAKVFASTQHNFAWFGNAPSDNLDRSKDLIEQYSVRGDPVPALRGLLGSNEGFGTAYHFDGDTTKGFFHKHERVAAHMKFQIEGDRSTHSAPATSRIAIG